ncbi:MAG: hypothetical protein JNJ65_18550 [Cyclobacteriaceae bacterium]|jgi:cell division protein FtsB|nr:hypothetical protein [Cyclobacteriaceae bacterium]
MNQRRRIFFAIFGVYHLIILIFVIYIESNKEDFGILSQLYSRISLMKYGAVLGIILFLVDFVWSWLDNKNSQKEHDTLRHENNTLKAKVYDLQQPGTPKESPATGNK